MANENRRDKNAEKAVRERLKRTHISSFKIVGSKVDDSIGIIRVYVLRIVGNSNYLFKIHATVDGEEGMLCQDLFR